LKHHLTGRTINFNVKTGHSDPNINYDGEEIYFHTFHQNIHNAVRPLKQEHNKRNPDTVNTMQRKKNIAKKIEAKMFTES